MTQYTIGIDVGGTNIKLGLISATGRIIYRTTLNTKSFIRNRKSLVQALTSSVKNALSQHALARKNIKGIGIGLPGLIDIKQGMVNFLVNIPGWKKVPLQKMMEDQLHVKTVIDNDVNVMTLGEWKMGAGRGAKNIVCLTLGTGVGGGLVIDGKMYRGLRFTAGEVGHVPLNEKGPSCNCGGYGCLEKYVGNRPLLLKAQKIFKKKDISLEDVTALAERGDQRAVIFWKEAAAHLGNALAGVINLLNPERIIIGGGVANAHRFLFDPLRIIIRERAMKIPASTAKIVKAKLGDNAGIIGAHVLVGEIL